MDRRPIVLAAAVAAGAVGILALAGVLAEVPGFIFGCYQGPDGPSAMSPDDRCASIGVSSETTAQALARLVLIQGSAIAASAAAIMGAMRSDGRWFAGAGLAFGVLVVPLFFGIFWILLIPVSALCFAAAFIAWPRQDQVPA